jgi:uncharacterized protein involved in outer membrane biogenesis
MLKKLLIGLGVLLLLAVVAVAVGPRFVDWNAYKPRVIAAVRDATGRELSIDGDISLSLLPSPTLSVAGVRLANIEGGSTKDMAQLKSLDVSVALIPLISGNIQVTKVTLVDPVVLLEQLPDGRANWQFAPPSGATAGTTGQPSSSQGGAGGGAGGGVVPAVSVDNFSIENGTIIYRSGATEERIEALTAAVTARSLKGPFTAAGSAKLSGVPAKFDVAVGALGAGPTDLKLLVNMAGDAAILQFEGTADQAAVALKGKLLAKITEPGLILKIAGVTGLPPALTKPFMLSATVDASAKGLELPDLTIALGDDKASGHLSVQAGAPLMVEATLAFGRLDLDKLLPEASAPAEAAAPAATGGTPSAPAAGGGGFALPGGIAANFDFSAEAIVYHKGVIEHPRLAGQLAEGELQIKQASARLPGGSDVSLVGTVAGKDGQPQFVGALQAKSDKLSDLLAWLGASIPPTAGNRLQNFAMTSRVIASAKQAELADLDIKLDATHIQGGVNVALPDGKTRTKPGFGIGLTVDQVDLDGYMPVKQAGGGTAAATTTTTGTGAAPAKKASPLAALAPLADVDANFDLRAGVLTLNGQAVRGLHLQGTLFAGKLTIADASVKDIGGGQGSVSGSIVDLAKEDPRYDLKLALAAPNAGQVFQLAGLGKSAPGKLGALSVNGAVKGGADNVDFDLAFAVTGAGVQGAAKGRASGLQGGGLPRVDTTINATAKNAGPLLQLLGVPADAAAKLGALGLNGKATSGQDSVDYDLVLDLPGLGGKGAFQGKVTSLSKGAQIATNLKLDVAQAGPLLALAGLRGPGMDQLGAMSLAGKANTSPDAVDYDLTLALPGMGGQGAFQGRVTGLSKAPQVATNLKLDVAQPGPLLSMAGLSGASAGKVGALGLSGRLDGGTDAMKLALNLVALGGKATVQGNVAAARSPIAFDLTISADHPDTARFLAAVVANYRGPQTAGPLKLNAHVAGDARKFKLDNFVFRAADSDLNGAATVGLGARPSVQGSFASNSFNMAVVGAASGGDQGQGGGQGQADQGSGQASGQAQGGGHWSRKPIDLSALDQADAVIDYKAGQLISGNTRIGDLVARINLAAGTLVIETLTGKVYGGSFALQNGRVVGRGTPSFTGRVITQNLELSQLSSSGHVKGPISVNADIAGSGASEADIVASLQGRGKLAGRVTVLSKFEQTAGNALLGALGAKVTALKGITDVLGNAVGLFAGKPNDVAGDFVIERGVVTTDNTTASNPQARALFHGKINLPPWTMAMLVDIFKLPDTAKPQMTVNLQGSIDKPNVGVSGLAFTQPQGQGGSNPLQQLLQGGATGTGTGTGTGAGGTTGGGTTGGTSGGATGTAPANPLQQLLQGGQSTQQTAPAGGTGSSGTGTSGSSGSGSGGTSKPKTDPLAPILQNLLGGQKPASP